MVAIRTQRSRSPRGQRAQKQPLALKDKPTQKGKGGGKGRGKGKSNSKGGKSSAHDSKGADLFDEFQQKHKNTLWHERANGNPGICWRDAAKCNIELRVFRTKTVCLSKQSSERLLLLNERRDGCPVPSPVAVNLSPPVRVLLVSAVGAKSIFFDPPSQFWTCSTESEEVTSSSSVFCRPTQHGQVSSGQEVVPSGWKVWVLRPHSMSHMPMRVASALPGSQNKRLSAVSAA